MKPGVFTYENSDKQTVWYRGYVKRYTGVTVEEIPCSEVRKNRIKAMEDAKRLIRELKKKI